MIGHKRMDQRGLIFAALFALAISGNACQTTILHFAPGGAGSDQSIGQTSGAAATEPRETHRHASLAFGIYELSDAPPIPCPGQLQRIVFRRDWLDIIIILRLRIKKT